jgi:hypothetical protein
MNIPEWVGFPVSFNGFRAEHAPEFKGKPLPDAPRGFHVDGLVMRDSIVRESEENGG